MQTVFVMASAVLAFCVLFFLLGVVCNDKETMEQPTLKIDLSEPRSLESLSSFEPVTVEQARTNTKRAKEANAFVPTFLLLQKVSAAIRVASLKGDNSITLEFSGTVGMTERQRVLVQIAGMGYTVDGNTISW